MYTRVCTHHVCKGEERDSEWNLNSFPGHVDYLKVEAGPFSAFCSFSHTFFLVSFP